MLKRYNIWDKNTPVITPIGEYLTPEQWVERYPAAGNPNITIVCGAGEINGSFYGILPAMVQMYESMGADFSGAETDIEKLEVIEAFEDAQNAPPPYTGESSPEERIAAALELQNLLNMPTVNDDDPDEEV